MNKMPKYKAAIFDMDGTVLNTLDDLTDSMNFVMAQAGRRHDYTPADTALFFGSGVNVAVRRALATEAGASRDSLEAIGTPEEVLPDKMLPLIPDEEKRLQEAFREYYSTHCDIKTGPYNGIPEAIKKLRAAGIKTAVVSNKQDNAVQALAADCFPGLFDIAVGEKEGIRRKPAPDMTNAVLAQLGIEAAESVYLGDSEIDMQTAANSHMDCISVSWGFRPRAFLESHGAEVIADSPDQIPSLVI